MTDVLFCTNSAQLVSVGVFDQVDTSSVLEGEGLIRVRCCGFSPPVSDTNFQAVDYWTCVRFINALSLSLSVCVSLPLSLSLSLCLIRFLSVLLLELHVLSPV